MSRYITKTIHKDQEVEICIGYDINGKYFFDVFDKKEKLLDGSIIAKYSLKDVRNKAKEYNIKIPSINTLNFRIMSFFDCKTGIITN